MECCDVKEELFQYVPLFCVNEVIGQVAEPRELEAAKGVRCTMLAFRSKTTGRASRRTIVIRMPREERYENQIDDQ